VAAAASEASPTTTLPNIYRQSGQRALGATQHGDMHNRELSDRLLMCVCFTCVPSVCLQRFIFNLALGDAVLRHAPQDLAAELSPFSQGR